MRIQQSLIGCQVNSLIDQLKNGKIYQLAGYNWRHYDTFIHGTGKKR